MNEILLNKEIIRDYIDNLEFVKIIALPELKHIFNDITPVIKIKGASLDDHIKANDLGNKFLIIIESFLKDLKNNKFDLNDFQKRIHDDKLHPNTMFEILLFQKCVIEPKFSLKEVILISEKMPEIINKICKIALKITVLE